jgi:nitrate reductase cytochrome c-type subunit
MTDRIFRHLMSSFPNGTKSNRPKEQKGKSTRKLVIQNTWYLGSGDGHVLANISRMRYFGVQWYTS